MPAARLWFPSRQESPTGSGGIVEVVVEVVVEAVVEDVVEAVEDSSVECEGAGVVGREAEAAEGFAGSAVTGDRHAETGHAVSVLRHRFRGTQAAHGQTVGQWGHA